MEEVNIDFKKYITHNDKNRFKLIKTKTNRYSLVDCETKQILATTKREILKVIKEYGIKNNIGGINER